MDGVRKLARHRELKTLEFMPLLSFDLETLRVIIDGNPNLTLLLLPRESVSDELQRQLS